MKQRISFAWILVLGACLLPRPADAAFHFMEIQQVIGGVGGDTTAQAIQIRQRFAGNNILTGTARLVVRDAAGANPVTLTNFGSNVANAAACAPILIATPAFLAKTTPAAVANFTMAQIPASYLPAGSLTFEAQAGGTVLWRVSWGGAAYTGVHTTDLTNGDGNASPAFADPLPSGGTQALAFTPACATASTSNSLQYAVTAGAATFTNNAGTAYVVTAPTPVPALPSAAMLLLPSLLGLSVLAFAILRRRTA